MTRENLPHVTDFCYVIIWSGTRHMPEPDMPEPEPAF